MLADVTVHDSQHAVMFTRMTSFCRYGRHQLHCVLEQLIVSVS